MNYTTYFYVSPSTASVDVKSVGQVFEGQYIKVYANITYPNGTEITTGIFTATLIPYQNENQQIFLESENEVPLQYNSTLKEWVGLLRVPGGINATVYTGNSIYSLAGPWKIAISGASYNGYNSLSYGGYVQVEPYVYLPSLNLGSSKIMYLPLITEVNGTYEIQGVYIPALNLSNGKYMIQNSIIGSLVSQNSTVIIEGSTISTLTSLNSNLELINTKIENNQVGICSMGSNITLSSVTFENINLALKYVNSSIVTSGTSFINVSKISNLPTPQLSYPNQITYPTSYILANITNYNTSVLKIIKVLVDGKPVNFSVSQGINGVEVKIPFNSTEMPSGVNAVLLKVYNGMYYDLSFSVDNQYPFQSLSSSVASSVSSTRTLALSLGLVAIILSVLAIIITFRKGGGKSGK